MEALAVEIGKLFLEKPISGAFKDVRYAIQIKSRIKRLKKMKPTIEAWVVDANSSHLTSESQRLAVEQLTSALDQLRHLLDVSDTRSLIISTHCGNNSIKKVLTWLSSPSLNPVVSSFTDARRVRAFSEELDSIASPHTQFSGMLRLPLETAVSPTRGSCLETGPLSSEEVIGRDVDRDNVVKLLIDSSRGLENYSVVSIVAKGGGGKTTLAQYVVSDERVRNHFDIRIWVHVPGDLVAKNVVRKMVEIATHENIPETTQLAQLQPRLHDIISRKKCLLVIDNIWDHNLDQNWPSLMQQLGFGVPGSMVLTTTRSLNVAKTIGSFAPYMLGDLEFEESWRLFKIHAFRHAGGQESSRLEAIGKQIVGKCPQVPLVIRSLGRHLGGQNRTISYWEEFRGKLDSLYRCDGFLDVLKTLKLTYDDLDYRIKRCFACCSLFEKGDQISENECIYLWIALDLIELPSDKSQTLVDIAKEYIVCLKKEGLFIPGEGMHWVKIHDVLHDLALSMGSFKFKMMESETQCVDEMVAHISFSHNAELSGNFPCPSILKRKEQMQSLLLQRDFTCPRRKLILKGLSGFKRLKVLGLYDAGLEEMPGTIGELQLLKYLDLSHNPLIKKLPSSITKLVNLVYLNLEGCTYLEELPVDLDKLQKLIYLNLIGCESLRRNPAGITKLVNLRELHLCWNMMDIERLDDEDPNELAVLNCMNNLEGELQIIVNESRPSSASEAKLNRYRNLKKLSITFKSTSNRERHEMMLEAFQPHTNLRRLKISGYLGERLPSWIEDMSNLEEINIFGWKSRICVGSFGMLPRLKKLEIEFCWNMEYIESSTTIEGSNMNAHSDNTAAPMFPSLEILSLFWLRKLEGWRSSGNNEYCSVGATAFPKLKKLRLLGLGLEAIPEEFRGLSSLKELEIVSCEQLEELPEWIDTFTSLKQLFIIDCPKLRLLPKQTKLSSLFWADSTEIPLRSPSP